MHEQLIFLSFQIPSPNKPQSKQQPAMSHCKMSLSIWKCSIYRTRILDSIYYTGHSRKAAALKKTLVMFVLICMIKWTF